MAAFFVVLYIPEYGYSSNRFLPPAPVEDESVVMTEHGEGTYVMSGNFLIPSADLNETIKYGYGKLLTSYIQNQYEMVGNTAARLTPRKQTQIEKILQEMAGGQFTSDVEINTFDMPGFGNHSTISLDDYIFDISLAEYYKYLIRAGHIIGRNSLFMYPETFYVRSDLGTYEQALEHYYNTTLEEIKENRLSGGTSRLFGTFMGIPIAVLPVFMAIFSVHKDKKINELIFSKSIKSYKYICIKFASISIVCFLPILILAVISPFYLQWFISPHEISEIIQLDYFAYIKVSVIWILPTLLFIVALSILISYLVNPLLALILPVLMMTSIIITPFIGAYGLNAIFISFPRVLMNDLFDLYRNQIYINRMFYILLSGILTTFTVLVYDMKRKAVLFDIKSVKKKS
jgi:hypothetical protein